MKEHSTLGKVSLGISVAILIVLLLDFLMAQYEVFKYGSAKLVQLIVFLSVPAVALANLVLSSACLLYEENKRKLFPLTGGIISLTILLFLLYVVFLTNGWGAAYADGS